MTSTTAEKHILDFRNWLNDNRAYVFAFFRKVKAVRYFSTMICIGLLIFVWGELNLPLIGSGLITIFLAGVIAASKYLACLVSGANRFSSLEVVTVAKQHNALSGLRSLLGNNKRLTRRREVSKLLTMSEKRKFDIYNYLSGMVFLADSVDISSIEGSEEDTEINH